MKNLDTFSKRFLTISISLSVILLSASLFIFSRSDIQSRYTKRMPFSHKGSYGHALIVAGSHHKMGACILASRASLRSGAGLVTVYIPEIENSILQMAVPEAMTETYLKNEIE